MKKYLFLSWFYKDKRSIKLFENLVANQYPCRALKDLYRKHEFEILELLEDLKRKKIIVLTLFDKNYPDYLKRINPQIFVFCAVGNLELLTHENRVAVVGSRRPKTESLAWLFESMSVVTKDVLMISGGAIGVDQFTHRTAHHNKLKGVCVSPVGILEVYPKSLKPLLKTLLQSEDFLLVSQFHPKQKVCRSLFHPRNYLIAALSKKVVVVEARKKSGTMITAKFAADLGREVYAVPGAPWDLSFKGNVHLLEEGAYQIIDLNFIHL